MDGDMIVFWCNL